MNPPNKIRALAAIVLTLPLAGVLVVCSSSKSSSGTGAAIHSIEETGAMIPPPRDGDLLLAGSPLPITVEAKKSETEFTIRLVAFNEEIETEIYRYGPTEFCLVEAAGERYDPPLPILKFPMNIGDTWSWNGNLLLSTEAHATDAKVTTTRDALNVEGFDDESIKVKVELSIESGGPEAAKRTLAFWFVPGKGLLKREFGQASSRVPVRRESSSVPEKVN